MRSRIDATDEATGARIRLRRTQLGLTQKDLAEALGMTFQQVQKYERGINRVAGTTLVKIARKLECSVGFLLGEDQTEAEKLLPPQIMVTPGAVELLDLFSKIASGKARAALLSVAKALACEPA